MPKFNFELFKTLILNFLYIQSKRITLGMFILSQKYQFVYLNKVNSPPIRQFPSFSTFGHETCHVIIIKRHSTRKPQGLLLGKNSFCSRSPGERYCQSFICSEHTFDPGLKPLDLLNLAKTTVSVLHRELEYKVEKLKYKKLEII